MNDLKKYRNLYGLNFYLGNKFHNFEQAQPDKGYFFCAETDMELVIKNQGGNYTFSTLTTTDRIIEEIRQKIVLSSFVRK